MEDININVIVDAKKEYTQQLISLLTPRLFEGLNQIYDSIDVKNYGGKRDSDESHIVLNALDGTQVKWGAGLGESERYLEAIDKEKLAGLYQVYEQNGGTILGILKFIELRDPQRLVPRPGSE